LPPSPRTASVSEIPACARELVVLRLPLPFASLAVAVGHAPRDDEEPLPAVWSSNIGSANARPDRIIPALGKLSENLSEPSSSESCDVLHDDDSRSKFANDSRELEP
jgi:hypothetical protein